MIDALSFLYLPIIACVIFTGIHAYLGFHVIKREVIFVDLAMAQLAMLGAGVAVLAGFGFDSTGSYITSLLFALGGAAILALTRLKSKVIPQEALIGIVYVVSAASLILILSRTGEGDQHIRQMLTGNLLLVTKPDVVKIAVLYSVIGILHFIFRQKFFLLSENKEASGLRKREVFLWDFLFYAGFALVITSSVRIAGVLVVFSFLVIPPVCALLTAKSVTARLLWGWGIGFLASAAGLMASYQLDLPTGASIICAFGSILIFLLLLSGIRKKA